MIKIGILGTGFGKVHASIYDKMEGVEVAGIFGGTPETLNKLKEEFDVHVTTNADDLLHDPEIDLIDVCLPTSVHREYGIQALKQKKHVFCETPVSYALEDAEEMRTVAKEYNRVLLVNLFFKFSDPHRFAIDKIKSKALGNPLVVTAYQKTPPHWGNMNLYRMVQDFTLHNFDFINEIMGTPKELTARGIHRERGVECWVFLDCLILMVGKYRYDSLLLSCFYSQRQLIGERTSGSYQNGTSSSVPSGLDCDGYRYIRDRRCLRPADSVGLAFLLIVMFPANIRAARKGISIGGRPSTPLVPRTILQIIFLTAVILVGS
ncbi:oxidoreductase family protein [Melghirimyces profundicolus]|uniref:Oxidoreductase family protein n=1 Tax=Melghirimyces profundicolus TaxID=1242148 RepID=A0A2T6BXH3_9BACL|nr:oxidoreductase family protein [Melghirimyces profundicolus]